MRNYLRTGEPTTPNEMTAGIDAEIKIAVSNAIRVEGLPDDLVSAVMSDLTLPNPEHITRERMGKWTGGTPEVLSLAYWSDGSLILPRGYIGSLLARVKHAGLRYSIADGRLTLPQIDIQMNGELKVYQETAINIMTRYGSGILVAPCGSGKTVFGMALIAHWRQPSLILVHTKQLMKQTAEAVKHWLRIDPGLIGDGVCDIEPVTVGMLQTLASRPELADSMSGKFGLVLQDEVHHAPCDTATDVLQRFPAAFRYGLTAMPTRRDGLSPFMEALIGPIRHEITNADLRNAGVLVTPRIEWVRTDFQCDPGDWVYLIDRLVSDGERNALIIGIIERLLHDGRQIIALSERVAHVEALSQVINEYRPGAAVVVTGSMGKRAREEGMRRIASGEAQILFSTKLADEGLNLPDLDALILLTPSRSGGRTMQRVRRVLRSVPGKAQPVIIDIVDANIGLLASQARTRFFDAYRSIAPDCRLPEWLERQKRRAA